MEETLGLQNENLESTPQETSDVDVLKETPKKRNWGMYVLLAFLFIFSVGLYFRSNTSFDVSKKRAGTQLTPTESVVQTKKLTTLTVAVDESTKSSNMVKIPVTIDTGENTVSAVELHIALSPYERQTVTIAPGTFFVTPTILANSMDKSTGIASITLGSLKPKKGTGTLAIVSIIKQSNALSTLQIILSDKTRVAALGETDSVVKELVSGSISL